MEQSRVIQHESTSFEGSTDVHAVKNNQGSYKSNNFNKDFNNISNFNRFQNNQKRNVRGSAQQLMKAESCKASGEKISCNYCNYQHIKGRCPAYGVKCKNCEKLNHYASICKNRNRQVSDIACELNESIESFDDFYIDMHMVVESINFNGISCWTEILKLENHKVEFKLDTASKVNIINRNIYEKIKNVVNLKSFDNKLEAYGGSELRAIGLVKVETEYKGKIYKINFVVVDFNARPLLGPNTCLELGLLCIINSVYNKIKNNENIIEDNKIYLLGKVVFPINAHSNLLI